MRASLIERDDSRAAACIIDDGLAPEQRLSVYRHTFASNLANALRLSFPAVQRLVGAEFFEGAAQVVAHERPPLSAYLDEYGGGFSDFLARFPAAAALAYLPDVHFSLGVKTVRRTLSTHSSDPDSGQQPTGIDRALRLLIPLPVLIRNDEGESDGQA
jgi:hypothetical protein